MTKAEVEHNPVLLSEAQGGAVPGCSWNATPWTLTVNRRAGLLHLPVFLGSLKLKLHTKFSRDQVYTQIATAKASHNK